MLERDFDECTPTYFFLTMRSLFITLLLLFVTFVSQAQFTIYGTVTDAQNDPLEDVTINLDDQSFYLLTNANGEYRIEVSQGSHTLHATRIGYDDYSITIQIEKDTEQDIKLIFSVNVMDEVLISAIREKETSPMSFSELSKSELSERNLGQDLPILLNYLPSVVTTSDAGAGVGYTGMRVRGSDATRVNVTINGVPYNDSESQTTYWVDLPDFTSSVENVQLVRGVGSSTNGSGAFGANLSLLTDGISNESSVEISSSAGSFNTRKASLKFDSGLLNNSVNFIGRLSRIKSDGYIDRASSDLSSYFTQLSYNKGNTMIKALAFGGLEETYQAWYGVDPETLASDRTHNFAGEHYDDDGNVLYYDNQVDHYSQDHYQLLLNQKINDNFNFNLTGHYTWGRGYYEQYKQDENITDYINAPVGEFGMTDLIRRKWLNNNFYGAITSVTYHSEKVESILGFSFNQYNGDHFGEIIWAEITFGADIRERYYDFFGNKTEKNIYWKNTYSFSNQLQLFTDVQLRNVRYNASGVAENEIEDVFSFFNPKVGLSYKTKSGLAYISYALANKEPSRNDYENGNPKQEELSDLELGYRVKIGKSAINVNTYFMNYKNQLVLTGALDDTGAPVKTNIGESYRAGLEFDANFVLHERLHFIPNITLSKNENINFFTSNENGLEELGNTKISFSPGIIAGNRLAYNPVNSLWITLLTKYVGEQFMGNIEAPLSKLDSYLVNDVSINYTIKPKTTFKSINLSLLLNNILDAEYESNGYWGPGYVGYYPQAGFNLLGGVSFKF